MPESRPARDPFGPLETVVGAALGMVGVSLALVLVAAVVGLVSDADSRWSFATIGDPEACALVSNEAVPAATDVPQSDLRRGSARAIAEQVDVCLTRPTPVQKVASTLTPVGDVVFGVGALLLLRRSIRTARDDGLFGLRFAGRVRELGWFVLLMSLLWPFVAAAGRGVVLAAAVRDTSWTRTLYEPGISWGFVVVGVGVVTVARVLRRAVVLQEDVDETV